MFVKIVVIKEKLKKCSSSSAVGIILFLSSFILGLLDKWFFIIGIAGFIGYGIYRSVKKTMVCEKCKSENIIPVDSPEGEKLIKK